MMRMETIYPFTAVVGQEQAKKALLIALVNQKAGGLLIGGAKGTAKSVLARSCAELAGGRRLLTLPLNVTEDMLFGSIDIEYAVSLGVKRFCFTMNCWRKTPAARSRSCASAAGSCWRSAFRAARSGGQSSACSTRWPRRGWRMNTALLCAARSGCTAAAGAERQTEGSKKRWRTSWIIWTGAATCR